MGSVPGAVATGSQQFTRPRWPGQDPVAAASRIDLIDDRRKKITLCLKIMAEATRQKSHISFTLNGEAAEVAFAPHKTLLEVLREDLGLTGTKHGCELGECGTCTILVDGRAILSCLMLGLDAEGREVETIEGMAEGGQLHPLQV